MTNIEWDNQIAARNVIASDTIRRMISRDHVKWNVSLPPRATHATLWDIDGVRVVTFERGNMTWNGAAWDSTENHYIARVIARMASTASPIECARMGASKES